MVFNSCKKKSYVHDQRCEYLCKIKGSNKRRMGGYGKDLDEKSITFWVEIFSFYQKMRLHPFSLNLLA